MSFTDGISWCRAGYRFLIQYVTMFFFYIFHFLGKTSDTGLAILVQVVLGSRAACTRTTRLVSLVLPLKLKKKTIVMRNLYPALHQKIPMVNSSYPNSKYIIVAYCIRNLYPALHQKIPSVKSL